MKVFLDSFPFFVYFVLMKAKNISAVDLINARVYNNDKLYKLALNLTNIASDIQSISNVAKKPEYKNESFSADLIAEWMDEIQERIQTQLNNVIENS